MARPRQMDDREAVIVYLPKKVKEHFQALADHEQTSLSAVLRRVIVVGAKRKGV